MLVSRVPWPLEKGDKLRAFHQLKLLVRNHEVHLCCLNDKSFDQNAVDELKKITPHIHVIQLNKLIIGWRLIRALFSDRPFQVHYFYQAQANRKISKLIDAIQPDHIYCQLIRTSEYVKHRHEYKKTLDYMDALSSGLRGRSNDASWWRKIFVREEAKRLAAYENLIYDYFDHHTIISEQDRQLIFHSDRNKIAVIPNGIDAQYFLPNREQYKYHIAFTGNMSYPPNVDCALRLAKEILPLIQKSIPNVTLLIAGANPARNILKLQGDVIHVSGWMEDIRSAYDQSAIFMAPMRRGSGLQNKLLEAMCMTLPCITSGAAANAMNAKNEEHMLICESNEEFAAMAVRLLNQPDEARLLGERGRAFVVDQFDWPATVDSLTNEMLQR